MAMGLGQLMQQDQKLLFECNQGWQFLGDGGCRERLFPRRRQRLNLLLQLFHIRSVWCASRQIFLQTLNGINLLVAMTDI